MPRESVSFDRAASFYDSTRSMLPATADAITEAIIQQLDKAGAPHLLEVGIGTGRIARPILARGRRVTGVDISKEMMSRLRDQLTPQHVTPDLVYGDATRLPLRDNSFAAILTVHVLHLVADPGAAIAEIRRVLSPDGVYLHKVQRDPEPLKASRDWWDDALRRHGHPPLRRLRFEEQRAMIAATGAELDLLDVAVETTRHSPKAVLEMTKNRIHSWIWQVADDTFATCFKEYEPWFRDHYSEDVVEEATHELEVWRWP